MGKDVPSRMFVEFCKAIIAETEVIDRATPWSEREPEWWLDMMKIQRLAIKWAMPKAPTP